MTTGFLHPAASARRVPAPAPPPSSRRPRLGFLGVGRIGQQRLAAIAEADCAEIAAVADPSGELVAQACRHSPDAARGGSLEDLLAADGGLDGVVIATPSAQHAAQSLRALGRGLAVFCQKPLGRNAAEVSEVLAAARAADRLLGVDMSYRHTAAMAAIRPLVRSGELGEIFAVDLVFHNAYGPQKPWFYDPRESGGGCVVDLGVHVVDIALWVLDSPVVRVSSRLFHEGRRIAGRGAVCEDYATARLDLANGASVRLCCSWHLHAGCDAVIGASFHGTRGGAAMRNVDGSFYDLRAERFTQTRREVIAGPPDDWAGRAAVDWARRLAAGAGYDPESERLLEVARALDAIYEGAGDE